MSNGTAGIDLVALSASLLASSTTRRKAELQTLQHRILNSGLQRSNYPYQAMLQLINSGRSFSHRSKPSPSTPIQNISSVP